MNIQAILIPLLTNLVSKILSNQFTKQHINDDIDKITDTVGDHVRASHVEKDATILMLEEKLKQLVDKLDDIVNAKVDQIVKQVQDKTPFFLDPVVQKFGDEIKKEFDVFTDKGVDSLINFLETKAKDFGILKEVLPASAPVESDEPEVIPETETEVETSEPSLDFLSDHAQEILDNLKDKHKND